MRMLFVFPSALSFASDPAAAARVFSDGRAVGFRHLPWFEGFVMCPLSPSPLPPPHLACVSPWSL